MILACRNLKKAEAARKDIMAATGNQKVVCKPLDLASFRSVREFAKDITSTEQRLDILINNAGLLSEFYIYIYTFPLSCADEVLRTSIKLKIASN